MINMFDRLKRTNKTEELRTSHVFSSSVSKSCCEPLFITVIVRCVARCGSLNGTQAKQLLGIVSFSREDKNNNTSIDFMGSILVYLIQLSSLCYL